MKTLVLIASLMLSGTAVAAEAADDAGKKKDKLICRNQTPTGSRLGSTRLCMKESEWIQYRRDARQDVERRQTMRGANGG